MPPLIHNRWSLKKLLQNTYMHQRNRFEYKDRDVIRRIGVKKIYRYDVTTAKKRTTFVIESYSYPQYAPYYTAEDDRGRPIAYQRRYRHQYDVSISLDKLSINTPVKLRLGSDAMWDFGPAGKTTKKNGRIVEGSNVRRGINGDFFFRCSYLYWKENILYGKNRANGPPNKVNPQGIIFLPKHIISVVENLMNRGILRND